MFATNDDMALGAMRTLHRLGRHVPDDISLIGFDNIPFTKLITPELTTIGQPVEQMGEATMSLLLKQIEDPAREPETVILTPTLIERENCRENF